jgi:hypothetical protein
VSEPDIGLLLINDMSTNYWAITGEKKEPVLVVNYSYKYIDCTKRISNHEVPLAICLLKGISCVSTHYNTGLLLFYSMSNNYWVVSSREKI